MVWFNKDVVIVYVILFIIGEILCIRHLLYVDRMYYLLTVAERWRSIQ